MFDGLTAAVTPYPPSSLSQLPMGSRVHLMGICGTAMASLAGLLQQRGFRISGSDSNPYPPMSTQVESLGIQILRPYSEKNLQDKPDFVIVGNVISRSNVEVQEMFRQNIPYCSLPSALGESLLAEKKSIVIAGTHGKTTTSSAMAHVLENAGQNPGFLIGGIPQNFSNSFRTGRGDCFVIEGDEYDTAFFDKVPKFVHYNPRYVILTSIEFDHADIYHDLQAVLEAFVRLLKLIPKEGLLVYNGDDQNILSILSHCRSRKISYTSIPKDPLPSKDRLKAAGSSGAAGASHLVGDFQVIPAKGSKDFGSVSEKITFSICETKVRNFIPIQTEMTGLYNFCNLTAVAIIARELGVSWDLIQQGLRSFQGVKRRQEVLGEFQGVLVIEDFAHHPTAVRETLKGLKQKYPDRKMWAVFEPRSATSRRKVFQKDYVRAFESAQEVFVSEAFDQSKLKEDDRFSSLELVEDLKSAGLSARLGQGGVDIARSLSKLVNRGDMVVIMSNGGFDGIYKELPRLIEETKSSR